MDRFLLLKLIARLIIKKLSLIKEIDRNPGNENAKKRLHSIDRAIKKIKKGEDYE